MLDAASITQSAWRIASMIRKLQTLALCDLPLKISTSPTRGPAGIVLNQNHQSFDKRSHAALALAARLSLPESTFLAEGGGVPRKRAMRSSKGGWVENRLIKLRPDNGLTINMWAVDGLASMGSFWE